MKKILSTACAVLLLATALISCGKKEPEAQVLKVAGLKGAYGDAYWQDLKAGFEAANPGVTVELTIEAQVEKTINPQIMAGAGPDDGRRECRLGDCQHRHLPGWCVHRRLCHAEAGCQGEGTRRGKVRQPAQESLHPS